MIEGARTRSARSAGPARPAQIRLALPLVLLAALAGTAAFGDAAAIITLILRLYQAGHRAWAITALLFAILGPSVLLAPAAARILAWGGFWRSLAAVCAAQAVAAVGLIFTPGTAPTLLLVIVLGAGLALTQPALMEITPMVVGPDRLVWANSVTKSADWTGWTVGPLAGGALCAAGWSSAALGIEAASFVIAGGCFAALRLAVRADADRRAPAAPRAGTGTGLGLGLRGALAYLRADRELLRLIAAAGVTNACVSMVAVAEVFFARAVLGAGSFGFAELSSAWFAGMVTGTLLTAVLAKGDDPLSTPAAKADAWRPAVTMPAGIGLAGAGIIAAAMASGLPLAVGCYGVAGIGFGLQATVMRSLVQSRAATPTADGRAASIIGVWVAADMFTQLAGYLAGGAAMLAGARFTLVAAGAGLCSASCVVIALARMEVHRAQPESAARSDAVEGARVPVAADRPAAQRVPGAGIAGP